MSRRTEVAALSTNPNAPQPPAAPPFKNQTPLTRRPFFPPPSSRSTLRWTGPSCWRWWCPTRRTWPAASSRRSSPPPGSPYPSRMSTNPRTSPPTPNTSALRRASPPAPAWPPSRPPIPTDCRCSRRSGTGWPRRNAPSDVRWDSYYEDSAVWSRFGLLHC